MTIDPIGQKPNGPKNKSFLNRSWFVVGGSIVDYVWPATRNSTITGRLTTRRDTMRQGEKIRLRTRGWLGYCTRTNVSRECFGNTFIFLPPFYLHRDVIRCITGAFYRNKREHFQIEIHSPLRVEYTSLRPRDDCGNRHGHWEKNLSNRSGSSRVVVLRSIIVYKTASKK